MAVVEYNPVLIAAMGGFGLGGMCGMCLMAWIIFKHRIKKS